MTAPTLADGDGPSIMNMLARAWDEGAAAGLAWDENRETDFVTPNPYRRQA